MVDFLILVLFSAGCVLSLTVWLWSLTHHQRPCSNKKVWILTIWHFHVCLNDSIEHVEKKGEKITPVMIASLILMATATHLTKRIHIIDFMGEACRDQKSLFTDCRCLNARGQGRGISLFLTKSLFTVDSTEGSFLDQGSGLLHYRPAEEIMTCRCSAVGRKLVFLSFY